VRIFSPDESRTATVRLLVDTGSTLSWIPKELLTRLGVRPRETRTFRPIDNRESPLNRPVADARIECEGLQGVTGVVFAEAGDGHVLGVTALERLGLAVDPTTGSLTREDAFLAVASE
jgi:clan AA aspartic protease